MLKNRIAAAIIGSALLTLGVGCAAPQAVVDNSALDKCMEEQARLQAQMKELEGSHAALQEILDRRQKLYDDLRERLKAQIDAGEVVIAFRNGLMIIQLPNKILFESGKAAVSENGRKTLEQVAAALKDVQDRRFLVAGHTDNVPVKQKGEGLGDSNWDLSTRRGVAVLNILIKAGMSPNQVGAAGFGEHDPIADNGSDEGKASNRRIELIILPNLQNILGDEDELSLME